MPDAPENPKPTAPQPATEPPATPQPSTEPLGDGGKTALVAERKARQEAERELKELRAWRQEVQDKDKSELERAQSRIAELEQHNATAEARAMRHQIAMAHSLPAADLIFLTGSTEEELTAQATAVAEKNANRAAATAAPAFVPSPAQRVGNATPPNASVMTAAEGERRYREWQARQKL